MKKRSNLLIGLTGATALLAAPFIMSACQTAHSQLREEEGTMMKEGAQLSIKKCPCATAGKECDCQDGECGSGEKGKEGSQETGFLT